MLSLDFGIHNIHTVIKQIHSEEFENLVLNLSRIEPSLEPKIYKQLGIYYGYLGNNSSLQYLQKWQSLIADRNSQAYADTLNHIGWFLFFAGYQQQALVKFEEALDLFQQLEIKHNADSSQEIHLGKAFAMCHIGAVYGWQSMEYNKENNIVDARLMSEKSCQFFSNAIALQQAHYADPYYIAMSFYLQSFFFYNQNHLSNAKKGLQQAMIFWEKIPTHPIQFLTMQLLSKISMDLEKPSEAIELLLATYSKQGHITELNAPEAQANYAETLNLLGKALKANKKPFSALVAYLTSFKIVQFYKLDETQLPLVAITMLQTKLNISDDEINNILKIVTIEFQDINSVLRKYLESLQEAGNTDVIEMVSKEIEPSTAASLREHSASPYFHQPAPLIQQQKQQDLSLTCS